MQPSGGGESPAPGVTAGRGRAGGTAPGPDAPRGSTRRLSAIMFSDMVGYTALMQEDESRARSARQRQRSVLDAHVSRHGGRILQHYGDGALSVFDSAIAASTASIALSKTLSAPSP